MIQSLAEEKAQAQNAPGLASPLTHCRTSGMPCGHLGAWSSLLLIGTKNPSSLYPANGLMGCREHGGLLSKETCLGFLPGTSLLIASAPRVGVQLAHLKARTVEAQEAPRKSHTATTTVRACEAEAEAFASLLAPDSEVGRPGLLVPG